MRFTADTDSFNTPVALVQQFGALPMEGQPTQSSRSGVATRLTAHGGAATLKFNNQSITVEHSDSQIQHVMNYHGSCFRLKSLSVDIIPVCKLILGKFGVVDRSWDFWDWCGLGLLVWGFWCFWEVPGDVTKWLVCQTTTFQRV